MLSKLGKFAAICVLGLALTLLFASTFDKWFEQRSFEEAILKNLDKSSINSIKHAYAASALYSTLRNIGFSENYAEETVLFLGMVNECVEVVIKFPSYHDNALEMIKDMHNNLAGVEGAKWYESHKHLFPNESSRGFIGLLAKDKVLAVSREDMQLPEEQKVVARASHNPFLAIQWFHRDRDIMTGEIRAYLFLQASAKTTGNPQN